MALHQNVPPIFPALWANEWGEDEYGLWMAFSYQGYRHAFRWIQPGSFLMGSPADEKGREFEREGQVAISIIDGFWLGEFPVTQALYHSIAGYNPSAFKDDRVNKGLPVEKVSWNDVQDFILILNQLHPQLNAYLPLESQWEYACRAGTTTSFWFGNQIELDKVNFEKLIKNHRKGTNSCGNYPPNPWGLYDMHGNVFEWCLDPFNGKYKESLTEIRSSEILAKQTKASLSFVKEDKHLDFVLRGGSWNNDDIYCRSARRGRSQAISRYDNVGFRLALSPDLK